jgi:UDPglucose 6-dehydrogenase
MGDIYRPLFLRDFPVVFTDLESAEMIKYAANAFLATKITFINEIADLCEKVGADVKAVARAWGSTGGSATSSCTPARATAARAFPRTPARSPASGRTTRPPDADRRDRDRGERGTQAADDRQGLDLCGGSVNGKTVAVLGVTFKPNTDDMREAPSLTIVPALVGGGGQGPRGRSAGPARGRGAAARRHLGRRPYEAAADADAW